MYTSEGKFKSLLKSLKSLWFLKKLTDHEVYDSRFSLTWAVLKIESFLLFTYIPLFLSFFMYLQVRLICVHLLTMTKLLAQKTIIRLKLEPHDQKAWVSNPKGVAKDKIIVITSPD